MMMDGPTSERMVDPWIRHLTRLGVDIHFNTRVGDLEFDDGRVTALISSDGRRFACDYALLAVPYLTLRELAKSAHVKRYLLSSHSSTPLRLRHRTESSVFCATSLRRGLRSSALESSLRICKASGRWSAFCREKVSGKTSACRKEPATFCQ